MFGLEENLILSNVLIRVDSNFDDKYVKRSVQLVVRGSSFRNDLLQNPYFNNLLLIRQAFNILSLEPCPIYYTAMPK